MNKKNNNVLIVIIIIGIILMMASIIIFGKKDPNKKAEPEVYYKEEENKYVNNSEKLNSEKEFEKLLVSDIEFYYDKTRNETNMTFKVTNKTNKAFNEKNVLLIFVDSDGNTLDTMFASIPDLEINQSKEVRAIVSGNSVNVYDVIIEELDY